jgi:hypothetical protein
MAHEAGRPYDLKRHKSRPQSLHAPDLTYGQENSSPIGMTRSVDDMHLLDTSRSYGGNFAAQLSEENLQISPFASNFDSDLSSYDFPSIMGTSDFSGSVDGDGAQLARTTSADALATSVGWYDSSILTTVAEGPDDFSSSPSGIFDYKDADWTSIPSATSDFFSPSDLPLVTSQPDLSQPISHSGESNYQSAPALTASSSGAQSEIGEPSFPADGEQEAFPSYWSGTVQFRETNPLSASPLLQDFGFPAFSQSLTSFEGLKRRPGQSRHRQTYSAGSHRHATHLSSSTDSTTVGDRNSPDSGVNIGHLQNLASLKRAREAAAFSSSRSSPTYPPVNETELRSISIPAGDEDKVIDDWYFPLGDIPPSTQSADFAWLA